MHAYRQRKQRARLHLSHETRRKSTRRPPHSGKRPSVCTPPRKLCSGSVTPARTLMHASATQTRKHVLFESTGPPLTLQNLHWWWLRGKRKLRSPQVRPVSWRNAQGSVGRITYDQPTSHVQRTIECSLAILNTVYTSRAFVPYFCILICVQKI
jgi:hypothetical protein